MPSLEQRVDLALTDRGTNEQKPESLGQMSFTSLARLNEFSPNAKCPD